MNLTPHMLASKQLLHLRGISLSTFLNACRNSNVGLAMNPAQHPTSAPDHMLASPALAQKWADARPKVLREGLAREVKRYHSWSAKFEDSLEFIGVAKEQAGPAGKICFQNSLVTLKGSKYDSIRHHNINSRGPSQIGFMLDGDHEKFAPTAISQTQTGICSSPIA
jgi:hypothetical protein